MCGSTMLRVNLGTLQVDPQGPPPSLCKNPTGYVPPEMKKAVVIVDGIQKEVNFMLVETTVCFE